MIITAKLIGGQRITYPDLESLLLYLPRKTITLFKLSRDPYTIWINPMNKNHVDYFDEYDIPIPHFKFVEMVERLPKPKRPSYPTIQYGYKKRRGKWYRKPKTMNSKRQGIKHLPSSWDDLRRACNYDRSWKSYRKTQYHGT